MIESLAGSQVRERFEGYITTTQEIDFISHLGDIGLEVEWEQQRKPFWGIEPRYEGERVFIARVLLDGPAYKAGFNAGDEMLLVNGLRFLKRQFLDFAQVAKEGAPYEVVLSRLGAMVEGRMVCEWAPKKMAKICARDPSLVDRVLRG